MLMKKAFRWERTLLFTLSLSSELSHFRWPHRPAVMSRARLRSVAQIFRLMVFHGTQHFPHKQTKRANSFEIVFAVSPICAMFTWNIKKTYKLRIYIPNSTHALAFYALTVKRAKIKQEETIKNNTQKSKGKYVATVVKLIFIACDKQKKIPKNICNK